MVEKKREVWLLNLQTKNLLFPISLIVLFICLFRINEYPFEDAAILFRYAKNLGNGEGFVYNIDGEWIDGATDFVFTIFLAVFVWLGFTPELSAILTNTFSIIIILASFYHHTFINSINKFKESLYPSVITILIALLSPVYIFNFAGFGTSFNLLLVYFAARLGYSYIREPSTKSYLLATLVFSTAILNRNENTVLLILFVGAVTSQLHCNFKFFLKLMLAAIHGLSLAVLLRIKLFGFPFSNAYYIKGDGKIYIESLAPSLFGAFICYSIFLVILLSMKSKGLINLRQLRKLTILGMTVSFFWALIWILLSNEMNQAQRFQFPLLGVLLVLITVERKMPLSSASSLEKKQSRESRCADIILIVICLSLIAALGANNLRRYYSFTSLMNGKINTSLHGIVGTTLKDSGFAGNNYLLLTSEAGLVPYITGMNTIDAWGLNSKEVAHNGLLSVQDLKRVNPDVIFLHLNWARVSEGDLENKWDLMNRNILCFAYESSFNLNSFWSDNPEKKKGGSNSWIILTNTKINSDNLTKSLAGSFKLLDKSFGLKEHDNMVTDWQVWVRNCSSI